MNYYLIGITIILTIILIYLKSHNKTTSPSQTTSQTTSPSQTTTQTTSPIQTTSLPINTTAPKFLKFDDGSILPNRCKNKYDKEIKDIRENIIGKPIIDPETKKPLDPILFCDNNGKPVNENPICYLSNACTNGSSYYMGEYCNCGGCNQGKIPVLNDDGIASCPQNNI